MRIFVAGATGAVGRPLVRMLIEAGHDVVAMTRPPRKVAELRAATVEPVVADGLDRAGLTKAVTRAGPDVLIHQMTGLTGIKSFKKLDRELAATNRLRTQGVDNVLEAARAAGVGRVIAQSYGVWVYKGAGTLATEADELDPSPPATMSRTAAAIRYLESAVTGEDGIEGLVLRYGFFYGPGTGISADGRIAAAVRARKFPIVGQGSGVWSFIHVDDAAAAAVAAVERRGGRLQRRGRRGAARAGGGSGGGRGGRGG